MAAGLSDLSWPEFRQHAHTQDGGRLGAWLKRVEAFLHPVPQVTSLRKREPHLQPAAPRSSFDNISATRMQQEGRW